eukprot:scaffold395029_cov45-Prasinocladus_malaysianus.AAC.1
MQAWQHASIAARLPELSNLHFAALDRRSRCALIKDYGQIIFIQPSIIGRDGLPTFRAPRITFSLPALNIPNLA